MRRSTPRIGAIALLAALSLWAAACDGGASDGEMTAPPPAPPAATPPGADSLGPTLKTATFSPKRVNVSTGPELVTIFARVEDADPGVALAAVQFRGTSTAQITQFTELRRIDGDALSGAYEGAITIPQGAPGGTWVLMFIRADDKAGNVTRYTTEELQEMGIPVELEVFPR